MKTMAILTVYKPIGWTPLQCIDQLRELYVEYKNSPITYAGRLDPMAEGLLLLLTDEDRYKKDEHQKLDKSYEATILLGIETDSLDTLGIPMKNTKNVCQIETDRIMPLLEGTHELPFPNYSSYKVQGKPLHWWTQNNRINEIEIPIQNMQVLEVNNIRIQEVTASELLDQITSTIKKVSGNFRQEQIINSWQQRLNEPHTFTTISLTLSVTSGTYIRSLADMLGKQLGTGACLLSLKRTTVGAYGLKHAHSLVD
jgi:tRNA pseudouridine55 synthase